MDEDREPGPFGGQGLASFPREKDVVSAPGLLVWAVVLPLVFPLIIWIKGEVVLLLEVKARLLEKIQKTYVSRREGGLSL